MQHFKILFATLALSTALVSCKSSDEQIQNWVEKNPDKILTAIVEFQKKKQADQQPKAEDVKANSTALFENPESPSKGTGPIKIAYFFDFNCGHCARQSDTIKAVLAKTNKVQVFYKNLPVLGPSSELTARAALAAHQQGKYFDFYTEAFKTRDKNPESLKAIAKKIKLDLAKWQKDMTSEAVTKEISHVQELANKMKISGTPVLAIAPETIIPGRVDQLMEVIESIKQ
jgi:protein-disulfide isomerase